MLISYTLITLHLRNHTFQRTPLTPSEVDLAELSHEYFKDAISTTAKIYHFFFTNDSSINTGTRLTGRKLAITKQNILYSELFSVIAT
jgi:hypothetical protein